MRNYLLTCMTIAVTLVACTNNGKLPKVQTGKYTTYPATKTAQCEGYVETDGGEVVVDRGICYVAGSATPTIADKRISAGSGKGAFTAVLTDIQEGDYTYRAYATNSAGTAYGSSYSFTMTSSSTTGGGSIPESGENTEGEDPQPQGNYLKVNDKIIAITRASYEMVDRYALNPSYHCYTGLEFYNDKDKVIFRIMQSTLSTIYTLPTGTWYYTTTWTSNLNVYDSWYTSEYDYDYLNYYRQQSLESVNVSQNGNTYTIDIIVNSYSSLHYSGPVQSSRRTEYAN